MERFRVYFWRQKKNYLREWGVKEGKQKGHLSRLSSFKFTF